MFRMIPRDALPWVLLLAAILVILAIMAWAGYDNWTTDIGALGSIMTVALLQQI